MAIVKTETVLPCSFSWQPFQAILHLVHFFSNGANMLPETYRVWDCTNLLSDCIVQSDLGVNLMGHPLLQKRLHLWRLDPASLTISWICLAAPVESRGVLGFHSTAKTGFLYFFHSINQTTDWLSKSNNLQTNLLGAALLLLSLNLKLAGDKNCTSWNSGLSPYG